MYMREILRCIMNKYSEETLIKIEKELDLNCPSPESNLIKLGQCVATLPDSEGAAKLRRLVFDIDDLTAQIRWHLGQALLLMDTQPGILNAGEDDDPIIRAWEWPRVLSFCYVVT